MTTSLRWLPPVVLLLATVACGLGDATVQNGAGEDRTLSVQSIAAQAAPARGSDTDAQRLAVLADVQAALAHYRKTQSNAEAEVIEARFEGSPLRLNRELGALEPRSDEGRGIEVLDEAVGLAQTHSREDLEASLHDALAGLVFHASTRAPSGADARRTDALMAALMVYGVNDERDGGVVSGGARDGGSPDAGTTQGGSPPDGGVVLALDLCRFCTPPQRPEPLSERLACRGLRMLAGLARRYSADQQLDLCPSSDCQFSGGHEGLRGTLKWRDLLDGELSGRASYGFPCGGGILEVSTFGSGIFGRDAEYGVDVGWSVRF